MAEVKTPRRAFLVGAGIGALAVANAARAEESEGKAPHGARSAPGMTLLNFRRDGRVHLGVRVAGGILDVAAAGLALGQRVPTSTDEVIRRVERAGLHAVVAAAKGASHALPLLAEEKLDFAPAVTNPEKILMMGFNYRRHALETHTQIPTSPVLFNKFNNALAGHGATVKLPVKVAKKFDHEVELVIVMGKEAREVSEADALSHVFGYCTGNDFSARDLQFKTSQFMLGKTTDHFAPLGPYLVTADQVPDPQDLKVQCSVNGELRQSSNTSDMIFSCRQIISYISQYMTLKPGDLIFTGTPEGVIFGKPPDKQVWLKAGDQITTVVEKLGELKFKLG